MRKLLIIIIACCLIAGCGKTVGMVSPPTAPIVNEAPIVEKGHIARHPYIYMTLVATAVFLSSAYLMSELNTNMIIDEYVWYSRVLNGQKKFHEQVRADFRKSNWYKRNTERMVKVFRERPNSDFLPAK